MAPWGALPTLYVPADACRAVFGVDISATRSHAAGAAGQPPAPPPERPVTVVLLDVSTPAGAAGRGPEFEAVLVCSWCGSGNSPQHLVAELARCPGLQRAVVWRQRVGLCRLGDGAARVCLVVQPLPPPSPLPPGAGGQAVAGGAGVGAAASAPMQPPGFPQPAAPAAKQLGTCLGRPGRAAAGDAWGALVLRLGGALKWAQAAQLLVSPLNPCN